jgi:polar amino acid transport system substrate-binding protein
MTLRRLAPILLFVALLAGCTGAASPSPAAPSTAPSPSPSAAESAASSPSPSPAPIATVPADQLILAGNLFICSDIPYKPQEYFDDQGNPIGSDIEIGQEIGKRLGLQAHIENTVFNTIIAALTGNKCDIIVSAQNITNDRIKQVDMIPYFQAGQSFVVPKGNPKGINVQDDLCGKIISAETGTTEVDFLNGTHDYAGQGLSAACQKKGKAAITTKEYEKDSDAFLALTSGQVDAYFADSPVAGAAVKDHPDQFDLSGLTLGVAIEGISVAKNKTGLRDAVQASLIAMMNDGTYMSILKKYGVESGAVTAADASKINGK